MNHSNFSSLSGTGAPSDFHDVHLVEVYMRIKLQLMPTFHKLLP